MPIWGMGTSSSQRPGPSVLLTRAFMQLWGGQSWPRAGLPAGSAARSAAGLAESESAGWIARPTSRQNTAHGVPFYVRKPEMPALELISQLSMIHAEAMQNRGMQVMHVHGIL